VSLWSKTTGQGPDLVMLHGWGMNAGVWQSVLPALAEHYRVTVIELPGHGESTLTSDAGNLDSWVDACLDVAPARAAWLGWSLGGLIALRTAIHAPDRVLDLYLLAATPSFVQHDVWSTAMPASVFEQFSAALLKDAETTLKRFLGLQVKGAENARETLRTLSAALGARPVASAAGLEAGLSLLLRVDLRDSLKKLTIPSHWLLGERDTLVPVAMAEPLSEILPKARITRIAGAAHAPFLSHPEAFLQWLT